VEEILWYSMQHDSRNSDRKVLCGGGDPLIQHGGRNSDMIVPADLSFASLLRRLAARYFEVRKTPAVRITAPPGVGCDALVTRVVMIWCSWLCHVNHQLMRLTA
jgi:hypothetical protein